MWQSLTYPLKNIITISIHTSHAGCDCLLRGLLLLSFHFNPHIPCGMWLPPLEKLLDKLVISIHTSHAGCDATRVSKNNRHRNFNPHIPCGMWPGCAAIRSRCATFQSTHPMRDVTTFIFVTSIFICISIHTSHAGCDDTKYFRYITQKSFQSTHPMRDVTFCIFSNINRLSISIHTSHAGCDGQLNNRY